MLNEVARAIFRAAMEGDVAAARALAEVGGRAVVMLTATDGMSTLYLAALKGHVEVARALEDISRS